MYSIQQTATNQAYAYFDTRTRLWEFALGSLLALALPHLKPGRALRVVLGWAGLAAMLSCGLLLTVDRSFPGFIALWPTLAAAAIIVAGHSGSRFGVDRFLTWKPLVALGDNSYALYLWHWPLLVLALAGTGISHRTWCRAWRLWPHPSCWPCSPHGSSRSPCANGTGRSCGPGGPPS